MSFDWKSLIKTVAPGLATALGGPLAGLATKAVSEAVLGKSDGSPDELSQALAGASPDTLIKIKQAEQEFFIKMEELGIKRVEIEAGDRASARHLQETALVQDDKFAKRFIYWYAIGITFLSFVYFFVVTLVKLDTAQLNMANIILGFLLGIGLGTIIAFFYGTSQGSLSKTKDIITALKGGR